MRTFALIASLAVIVGCFVTWLVLFLTRAAADRSAPAAPLRPSQATANPVACERCGKGHDEPLCDDEMDAAVTMQMQTDAFR